MSGNSIRARVRALVSQRPVGPNSFDRSHFLFPSLPALVLCIASLAGMLAPVATRAADDLSQIRAELQQMRAGYEARIRALEDRLRVAEGRLSASAATSASTPAAAPLVPVAPGAAAPATRGSFNPEIGLVLGGNWNRTSRDPSTFAIGGFLPNGGEIGPGTRSFNLGESELVLSANIDPLFSGRLIAALGADNSAAVEEAVVRTNALGTGLSLSMGRMLSSIGYLNGQHRHAWDFVDAPLAYQAMFGSQFKTDGVQLKWLAPTDRLFEVALEIGNGGSFPGNAARGNGAGAVSLAAHVGDDLGDSASWRAGLSVLSTRASMRNWTDLDAAGIDVTNSFTGRSRMWIADAVWKWAPGGNATQRNFKLQGELFRRTENGSLTYDTLAQSLGTATGPYRSAQSGWYVQGVYQWMANWRVGLRQDRLNSGNAAIGLVDAGLLAPGDFPALQPHKPARTSLMVDWSPSEFSRLRLQLARDRSRPGSADSQVFLQYIMSLGAHGAHGF